MNLSEPTGLESFHHFIAKQLDSEASGLMSSEEAFALCREEQEALAAIQAGLADVAAGRAKSLKDFDRDFRERHSIEACHTKS